MLDRREKEEQVELKAHADEKLSLEEPAESSHIEPIGGVPAPTPPLGPVQRTGRWTPDEKILFLYGLKSFGKGRWKKISVYLPNR